MKPKQLLLCLLLFVVTTVNAQIFLKGDMNGDGKINIADVTALVNVNLGKTPVDTISWKDFEHKYVDLGLPSGTLWATCNIGANSPEEYGDYFAWGETVPYGRVDMSNTQNYESTGSYTKTTFNWSTYKWCKGSNNTLTKYCSQSSDGYERFWDGKSKLDLDDDAAYVIWGPEWRMPSDGQFQELYDMNYTTNEWIEQNGTYGCKITSKINGNSIFLPASGIRLDSLYYDAGLQGTYWSHTRVLTYVASARAWYLQCMKGTIGLVHNYRDDGRNVRPVRFSENPSIQVISLTMSKSTLTMDAGTTIQLSVTVTPSYASNKKVTWESSNESVASVDANGMITAVAGGTCTITATAVDNSGKTATCEVTVVNAVEEHECVDLGLPSGTLWATCNIGANSPEEYGDYFAWGETVPYDKEDLSNSHNYSSTSSYIKTTFSWRTYKWCNGDGENTLTKYCDNSNYGYNGFTDELSELKFEDDAAYVNWGSEWRMPSIEQYEELLYDEYTTTEWVEQNGVFGRIITSNTNRNSIFLPAAGCRVGDMLSLWIAGPRGFYWSRTLLPGNPNIPFNLDLESSYIHVRDFYEGRCCGLSVRPVRIAE